MSHPITVVTPNVAPACCVCAADLCGEVRVSRIGRPEILFCERCGYRYLLKRQR